MAPSSRDRISVDLRGLKATLCERANALGVSPSDLVRTTLTEAMGLSERIAVERSIPRRLSGNSERVRLCLRMSREQARATMEAARRAGMNPGGYVGSLVTNVPVLTAGGNHAESIATLVASSAELSTLSRNIHRLTSLLGQGNVRQALVYRDMLDSLAGDVRGHLVRAARVLSDLRPRSHAGAATHPNT